MLSQVRQHNFTRCNQYGCKEVVMTDFRVPDTSMELYIISENSTPPRNAEQFVIQYPTGLSYRDALEVFRYVGEIEKPRQETPIGALAVGITFGETEERKYSLDTPLEVMERGVKRVQQIRLFLPQKYLAWIHTPMEGRTPWFSIVSSERALPPYFLGVAQIFLGDVPQGVDLRSAFTQFEKELVS